MFIEHLTVFPHSQEIHTVLRYGDLGVGKVTLWHEYRSGRLVITDPSESMPEEVCASLVEMLIMQKLVEGFYAEEVRKAVESKNLQDSFIVPVDPASTI